MVVFAQYNTRIYVDNEINMLSEMVSKENAILSEQIKEYEKRLDASEDTLFEYVNKSDGVEIILVEINQEIDRIDQEIDNIKLKKNSIKTNPTTNGDIQYLYHGRLYIQSAGINVALYNGNQQYITDRIDSANIYSYTDPFKYTIADHNNQSFSKLTNVKIGTKGYIVLKNGNVVNIKCVDVFNGHNRVYSIVDENGVSATDKADYMMYTCRNGWENVCIYLWERI